MVLPMGALGDKIGFKRCCCSAALFFGASLYAALSPTALTLIASRALLAVGAAMIVPATLAGITAPLPRPASAMALGCGRRWAPAARPLARWWAACCWAFLLGIGVLINVPIVLVVIAINAKVVPRQPAPPRPAEPAGAHLIAAILMLVFSAKSALKGQLALWLTALVAIGGRRCSPGLSANSCRRSGRWWICDCSLIALF